METVSASLNCSEGELRATLRRSACVQLLKTSYHREKLIVHNFWESSRDWKEPSAVRGSLYRENLINGLGSVRNRELRPGVCLTFLVQGAGGGTHNDFQASCCSTLKVTSERNLGVGLSSINSLFCRISSSSLLRRD